MPATTASHAVECSLRAHLPLSLGDQCVGDALAAVRRRDVDLLGLVVDDHDETGDLAVDHGDGRVGDRSAARVAERLVRAYADSAVTERDIEMTVAPAVRQISAIAAASLGLGRADHSSCLRKTTQALWPPKPNEFETPTWISDLRASFGM